MNELYTNIRNRRIQLGMSQDELAKKLGYTSRSTIAKIEAGKNDIPQSKIEAFAKALETTPGHLMGWHTNTSTKSASNITLLEGSNVFSIPTYDRVSAGFGTPAIDEVIAYTPLFIECRSEAEETICIRVKGDSMFPKIEDGDLIQVRKQNSVDSGCVAVVLLDGDEGFVKKVEYGKNWIELHSFNPMYPIMRFENADVQRIRIVGLVKKVIKSL